MKRLWMAVCPEAEGTRVIVTEAEQVILKARLLPSPAHPRAMQWLIEAVALWQGSRVDAALCAGSGGRGSVTTFEADWFADFGGPLYSLELVENEPRRRRTMRDELRGLGDFADLKQLSLWGGR